MKIDISLNCDCKDWNLWAEEIFAAQVFMSVHGFDYKGKVFKYCPWCKKKLKVKKL